MAAPIGPGDWIEFVGPRDAGAISRAGARLVGSYRVGTLTVCEAVVGQMLLPDGRVAPGLKTRDVKVYIGAHEVWLAAHQWRPIYRPKQTIIDALKAPPKTAPIKEHEAA